MARDVCNPITLLSAVVTRLRDRLFLDESDCFLSLNPLVKVRGTGSLVYIVSPLSGQFDGMMLDGGGQKQATVNGGLSVTIRSYQQLDEPGHDYTGLQDVSIGVLQAATNVLAALTVWDPLDGDGNQLLRDQLSPYGYEIGKDDRTKLFMQIGFNTVFDWDLEAFTTTTTAAP